MNVKHKIASFLAAAVSFVAYGSMSEHAQVATETVLYVQLCDTVKKDTVSPAVVKRDTVIDFGTLGKDSLSTDSVRNDSTKKKEPLDAPVAYSATDSITYDAETKKAFLYGNGDVKYENMELKAERIEMNMDSSLVHAYGEKDSTGVWSGQPVYTQGRKVQQRCDEL